VSVALLCNKLVSKRFILILTSWQSFEYVIPKTPQRKRSFDQPKDNYEIARPRLSSRAAQTARHLTTADDITQAPCGV